MTDISVQTPSEIERPWPFETFRPPYDESRFLSGHGAQATVVTHAGQRVVQCTVDPGAPAVAPTLAVAATGVTLWSPIFWDFTGYDVICVPITNTAAKPITVHIVAENGEGDGERFTNRTQLQIPAGAQETIMLPIRALRRTAAQAGLLGMRGLPTHDDPLGRMAPERVEHIRVLIDGADAGDRVLIHPLYAGTHANADAQEHLPEDPQWFPFIDTFGQYKHAEWDERVASRTELEQAWAAEDSARDAAQRPAYVGTYGGSTSGVRLAATGRFRTENNNGRWLLVDPEGYPFFSMGVNCVHFGSDTPIDQRDDWFESPPWDDADFADMVIPAGTGKILRGGYEGTQPRRFSFYQANLKRRYGDGWNAAAVQTNLQRLWSWSFNTVGSWSKPEIMNWQGEERAPYAVLVQSMGCRGIAGAAGFWRSFPDVFDDSFRARIAADIEKFKAEITSPWCLGVYIDNEQDWGYDDGIPFLAPAVVASPAEQPAKAVMRDFMRQRYATVGAFNANWGTNLSGWDDFLALDATATRAESTHVTADLLAFEGLLIQRYFAICQEELRRLDPDVLYMGCRFSGRAPARLVQVASRYCDVLTYNLYWRSLSHLRLPEGCDRPILISEFHFATLGENHFHPGLIAGDGADGVAALFDNYLREGLADPRIVGFHWFEWCDQPNTGRSLDGENFGCDLVTITDVPRKSLINTVQSFMADAYAPGVLAPDPEAES